MRYNGSKEMEKAVHKEDLALQLQSASVQTSLQDH